MLLYYLSPEDKHYRHLLDMELGFRYDPGYWTPFLVNLSTIVYRKDKWSGEDIPKSWKDLLDPKYKGETVLSDPRHGGGGLTFYGLKKLFGTDYLEGLAKNNPMFVTSGGVKQLKIATGERSIAWMDSSKAMRAILDDKAPIDFVVPEEGGSANFKNVAILKGAPHPNCARLFMDHFLSKETREFFRDDGYNVGVRDDFVSARGIPFTLKTYKKIWQINLNEYAKEIREFLREITRIFGL